MSQFRQNRIKVWASCFSLVFILSTSVAGHASSQGVSGSVLTTTPISVDLTAAPGTSISTNLQAQNDSPNTFTVKVELEKFKALGDTGQAEIYSPAANDPSTSWVHFSENSFVAEPNVWNNVTVTIDVPHNAALGYYYAVLFEPQTAVQHSQQTIKGANAIFVLLNTSTKNEERKLQVTGFSSAHGIYEYLPATFTAAVKNAGNIFLAPEGDVFISRTATGKTLATLPLNSGGGNVLPDSSRQFAAKWSDGFPAFQEKKLNGQVVSDSKGVPEQQLVWNSNSSLSKFRFGKYYAHLALVYNDGITDQVTNATVSFWVIPYKLILLIIVIIAAIIVGWKMLKKSVKAGYSKVKTKKK